MEYEMNIGTLVIIAIIALVLYFYMQCDRQEKFVEMMDNLQMTDNQIRNMGYIRAEECPGCPPCPACPACPECPKNTTCPACPTCPKVISKPAVEKPQQCDLGKRVKESDKRSNTCNICFAKCCEGKCDGIKDPCKNAKCVRDCKAVNGGWGEQCAATCKSNC